MIDRKELLADLNMILELEEVSPLRVVRGQLSSALDWLEHNLGWGGGFVQEVCGQSGGVSDLNGRCNPIIPIAVIEMGG